MDGSSMFRTVYKTVDEVQIDTEVHLPIPLDGGSNVKHPIIIDIHGGAYILGSSSIVNQDQIRDCLERKWIVVVPNHRLCPQVNVLEGPIQDCRDLLQWIYQGGLAQAISSNSQVPYSLDYDQVFALGTSAGGHIATCLGFDVPRPVAGILDMYGPCNFSHPLWTKPLPHLVSRLPSGLTDEFINQIYNEQPIPTAGGVSLEGQTPGAPNFSDPRVAFAMVHLARGTHLSVINPSNDWARIDPMRNISHGFPPTFILHGTDDDLVPISLSRDLLSALEKHGVKCDMIEVPEEGHTFAGKMQVGSRTWHLQRKGFDFLESLKAK